MKTLEASLEISFTICKTVLKNSPSRLAPLPPCCFTVILSSAFPLTF